MPLLVIKKTIDILNNNMNPQHISDILEFPYKLDKFQVDAMEAILIGNNVLTLSHTGSGKSSVGEFGLANALYNSKRAIYTTPIKALSNQKYGDFQKKYPNASVGILTGDIKVNPDANILVATQEIICNMLYTNIDYFDDVGCLVIDETHYLRDADRGTVYEQTIAMLPKNITLVMLSATLPGADNLAKWVEEIKEKPCVITTTNVRPVPLIHQVYWMGESKTVLTGDTDFNDHSYKKMFNNWKEYSNSPLKNKQSNSTMLINFLDHLSERELFPALFFQFSRKGCEKLAKMVQRSFISGKEQTECLNLYDFYVRKFLGETGMQLSQVWMVRTLLSKGVCIHHSGLIPILKEIIEKLFDKGWIKVMFVTETFSVGINMPTKCVIFSELQKFDGKSQRCLLPAEYIQMAGRAGRRGKDTLGTVIYFPIPPKNMLTMGEFACVVKGKHSEVQSKFVMDPVLLLKCIETNRPASEVFEATLLSKEINSSIKGIDIELKNARDKISDCHISEDDIKAYDEILKQDSAMKKAKPKARKRLQAILNETKKELGVQKLEMVEKRNSILIDIKKLEKNRIDAENYIKETCDWLAEVLVNTGYIQKDIVDGESVNSVTLMGRACSGINESDAFLTIEYLIKLFERFDSISNIETVMTFVLGCLIDEKELNKDDDENNCKTFKEKYEHLFDNQDVLNEVSNELTNLRQTYENLYNEGRLRNSSMSLTPDFGPYVYLWIVGGLSFNEISEKMCSTLYEGNFVKNMLKVHNICEEFKNTADIYQNLHFKSVIENIQTKIIKDIVICDSLYIQS